MTCCNGLSQINNHVLEESLLDARRYGVKLVEVDEQRGDTVAVSTVLANPLCHHTQEPLPEPILPLWTISGYTLGKSVYT